MLVLEPCNPSPVGCNKLMSNYKKNYLVEYLVNIDIYRCPLAFYTPITDVYEKYDDISIRIC
jgi:hypothetical protein